jgi:hypothetical protein
MTCTHHGWWTMTMRSEKSTALHHVGSCRKEGSDRDKREIVEQKGTGSIFQFKQKMHGPLQAVFKQQKTPEVCIGACFEPPGGAAPRRGSGVEHRNGATPCFCTLLLVKRSFRPLLHQVVARGSSFDMLVHRNPGPGLSNPF